MITKKILYRGEASKNTHYYGDQEDDYYSKDGNAAIWQGKGAEALGLSGSVDINRFQAMLAGNYGHGITAGTSIRKDSNARSGLDLTFSAPKSVTIQALIGGDERLIAAHDKAVEETLQYIEKHLAESRQTINGINHVEKTGNLIIAKFRHETARAVGSNVPDPQLHTHTVIMNQTQREDGSWAALQNDKIVQLRKLQNTIYMGVLDREARGYGYEIRYEKDHIELAHISRKEIETFSKRQTQIAKELKEKQGLEIKNASRQQRETALLSTRQRKNDNYSRAELHAEWVKEANEIGMSLNTEHPKAKERTQKALATPKLDDESKQRIADMAAIWAIKHLNERETVMSHNDLLSSAISHAAGLVDVEQIERSLSKLHSQGKLIVRPEHYISNTDLKGRARTREKWAKEYASAKKISLAKAYDAVNKAIKVGRLGLVEKSYATVASLHSEENIMEMEKQGRNTVKTIIEPEALKTELDNTTLTPGQKDAIELILSEKDQIVGIQGLAGTGKSFALQSTQKLLNERGYNMIALAPYGAQVANLRNDGIQAKTVASQLTATDKQRLESQLGENTVVVIDEAGVIPVRQMEQLLKQLQPSGARIVLLGDIAQTKAVEAGRAFAMLQENGMKTALMGDIQRQKNENLKKAVELAATGQAKESLAFIERVAEIPDKILEDPETGAIERDSSARYETIANEYVSLSSAEQANTLIVTGTNSSRKDINERIHEYLGLAGKGHEFQLLTRHDTTKMQRRHTKYYTVGDIIQPERDYKNGLTRGNLYEVIKCDVQKDRLTVRSLSETNKEIEIAPKLMSKLSVYHLHEAELAAGDVVRVTRNNAALDLANGERYDVLMVTENSVTLGDKTGRSITLPTDEPLHLDYAYATTAHSAQGLTCDRVLYNAESFSLTTAQDTYYVSISREKHEVTVFTDDQKKLPKAIDRMPYKGLAHDLINPDLHVEKPEISKKDYEFTHAELEM